MSEYTVKQLENLIRTARININNAVKPQIVSPKRYQRLRRSSFSNNPSPTDIKWMRKRLATLEAKLLSHPNYVPDESAA